MPHRPKAKIIPFPLIKKQEAQEEQDVLSELKSALADAPPAAMAATDPKPAPRERAKRVTKEQPAVHVTLNGGTIGQIGDTHNYTHTTINNNAEKAPRPTVVVQTGVGVIDAQQKRRLLVLRDDVVEASKAGLKQKTGGAVMKALNGYMKVNKYDEILAVDFDKAVKWMMTQRAVKVGLASAPKKLPDWRKRRTGAIHARCKEKGFEDWQIDYMKKKFGKESMMDLPDDDLETLYRAVMGKK